MLGPRRVRVTMPSSLAPVFPDSISFTSCASSVCGYGSSKPARRSGVPGIGTAIRAPALIPRATPTATRFPRNCSTSGIGPSALPPSPTPNAISIMSPTSSTCAATSSLTAASLRHSTAKRRGAGCSRWKMAAAIPRASWSPPSGFFRRRRCRTFRVSFKGKSCHTQTPGCYIHAPDPRSTHEVTAEEREAFWEKLYAEPGFGIWQGNFRDMLTDRAANAMASDFIARKIRQRVHDPVVAEKLIPKNHGFGTRRVPLETGYYEVYNQPNVELVDINDTPIERITPSGIKTTDRDYAFDIIIYATGFDAITGAFDRIDIRGTGGMRLRDVWQDGPQTYLGVLVEGFPNLLMAMGPHAGLGNYTRTAEYSVEWVSRLIQFATERGLTRIEATAAGVAEWTDHVLALGQGQLMNEIASWMTGVNRNVAGKQAPRIMRYSGGHPAHREHCDAVTAAGYAKLAMR